MNRAGREIVLALLLGLAVTPAPVAFQGSTQAQSDTAIIATATKQLQAAQAEAARRTVEPLIGRQPGHRDARELAIRASILLNDLAAAYAHYDGLTSAAGSHTPELLRLVAIKEMQTLQAQAEHDPRLRAETLERLAVAGAPGAVAALQQERKTPGRGLQADVALARLGDADARRRVASSLDAQSQTPKSAEIDAARRSLEADQAGVFIPLLQHRDPLTRAAAAEALGAFDHRPAVEALRAMLNDPSPEVRNRAGMALIRLGDPAGRPYLDRLRNSPVADVRLKAVDLVPGMSAGERLAIAIPILNDPDPFTRARAAGVVARDQPGTARPVLLALLRERDQIVRREAARGIEMLTPPDFELYRQLLSDPEPWVRMSGASAVLQHTRPPG